MYKSKNTYRNWSKHLTHADMKELSETFPVSVRHPSDRVEIIFQDDIGKKISFHLNIETVKFLNKKLNEIMEL